MIKHIVLFKFQNTAENAEQIQTIKTELEALIGKVPTLKNIEVGINCNPAEQFHMSLTTIFDSIEDLHAYAVHPEHVAVGQKLRAIMESRACVDYQY